MRAFVPLARKVVTIAHDRVGAGVHIRRIGAQEQRTLKRVACGTTRVLELGEGAVDLLEEHRHPSGVLVHRVESSEELLPEFDEGGRLLEAAILILDITAPQCETDLDG